jgi:predicted nucleic acid-binding protein
MKVVVDTNIVFSTMLSKNSFLRQTLLRSDLQFYAPNYLFTELFKHKERILSLSSETEQNIYVFLTVLLEHIMRPMDSGLFVRMDNILRRKEHH